MSDAFTGAVLNLFWAQWRELGAPGVVRGLENCAIDPEWLIVHTPLVATLDARLDEQSFNWCVQNGDWVSVRRLRATADRATANAREAFHLWARDLAPHTRSRWTERPAGDPPRTSTRSLDVDFHRPSMAVLRARAILGVGARSDVLCDMLARPHGWVQSGDFDTAGYTRRAVLTVLSDFQRAGLLIGEVRGRTSMFRLREPTEVAAILRAFEVNWPRWSSMFVVTSTLMDLLERRRTLSGTLRIHAAKAATQLTPHAQQLGWPDPPIEPDGLVEWGAWHLAELLTKQAAVRDGRRNG